MNEEIRKIVEGYISECDYEKALSLLMKFGLWVKMGVRIVVSILIIRVLYHFKAFQRPFYRSTCSL